jgi:hypothetical protein
MAKSRRAGQASIITMDGVQPNKPPARNQRSAINKNQIDTIKTLMTFRPHIAVNYQEEILLMELVKTMNSDCLN